MNIPFDIVSTLVTGCYAAFCMLVVITLLVDITLSTAIKKFCCKIFISRKLQRQHRCLILEDSDADKSPSCFDSAPRVISLPIICTIAFSFGIFAETTSQELHWIKQIRHSARIDAYNQYCLRATSHLCPKEQKDIKNFEEIEIPKTYFSRMFLSKENHDKLYPLATSAFFIANNLTKREQTYFKDLANREIHINFTKSIITISGAVAVLLFLIFLYHLVFPQRLNIRISPEITIPISKSRLIFSVALLIVIVFAMLTSLNRKEQSYHDTIFGYHNALTTMTNPE